MNINMLKRLSLLAVGVVALLLSMAGCQKEVCETKYYATMPPADQDFEWDPEPELVEFEWEIAPEREEEPDLEAEESDIDFEEEEIETEIIEIEPADEDPEELEPDPDITEHDPDEDESSEYDPEENPPVDGDPEIEEELEPEPVEETLPFDDREIVEWTPFGFWSYSLRAIERNQSSTVATMRRDDHEGETVFEGTTYKSNPPVTASSIQSADKIVWAAYRLFNADGQAPSGNSFIIRRERKIYGNQIEVKYHTANAPDMTDTSLLDLAVLPTQVVPDPEKVVDIFLVYLKIQDGATAFLKTQVLRYTIDGSDVSYTVVTIPSQTLLTNGIHPDARLRILHGPNAIWLNAGEMILKHSLQGYLQHSYPVLYSYSDIERRDLLDLAVSPDGLWLAIVCHLSFSDGNPDKSLWSVHSTATPSIVEKVHEFDLVYDYYRTAFSPDGDYAVVADPAQHYDAPFIFTDLNASNLKLYSARQMLWGRPRFIDNPLRLFLVHPTSFDQFVTVDLDFETVLMSDIVESSEELR